MDKLIDTIAQDIGRDRLLAPADVAGRSLDPMGLVAPATWLIRPRTTDELCRVLHACHAAGQTVTVMGGATGLVGGLKTEEQSWIISLEMMNAIEIDAANRVAVVEAGVILQDLHQQVTDAGLCFPIDLGSRGSATIGGLTACNAGGEKALRFGMMREQVLGLEVVLADGRKLDLMNAMIKDNTGYDLKQLFIGAEGTLGIITRAVLRLRPRLPNRHTGFAALADFDSVLAFKASVEELLGNDLCAFEVMWPEFYEVVSAASESPLPVPVGDAYYVIFEAEAGKASAEDTFVETLSPLLEAAMVEDLVLANSESQRAAIWALRNNIPAVIAAFRSPIGYDVSVPLAEMERFAETIKAQLLRRWPHGRLLVFGHIGDNNLHLVISLDEDTAQAKDELNHLVYGEVSKLGGSISAEHGLGADKRDYLSYSRTPDAISIMGELKTLFDPAGILQPGKLLPTLAAKGGVA